MTSSRLSARPRRKITEILSRNKRLAQRDFVSVRSHVPFALRPNQLLYRCEIHSSFYLSS